MGFPDDQGRRLHINRFNFDRGSRHCPNRLALPLVETSRQATTGNQAMQRFAQSCPLQLPDPGVCPFGGACHKCPAPTVQAEFKIGRADDVSERDADRVAEKLLRFPEDSADFRHLSNPTSPPAIPLRSFNSSHTLAPSINANKLRGEVPPRPLINKPAGLQAQFDTVKSPGQPLPVQVRNFFEPRFGKDFSSVRVFQGSTAETLSAQLNAKAFTVGHDLVFGAGEYSLETREGKRLLAHELAHVVQKSASAGDANIVRRDVETRPTRQNPVRGPMIQDCTFIQELIVRMGITEARRLAGNARRLIEAVIAGYKPWVRSVAESHFGHPLDDSALQLVAGRYRQIENTLNLKTYSCRLCARSNLEEEGFSINPDHRLCALGGCPGHDIIICQQFGEPDCPPGPVIIHESAHNAGACRDITRRPGKYPPSPDDGIDNAYSYEYFAVEVYHQASP